MNEHTESFLSQKELDIITHYENILRGDRGYRELNEEDVQEYTSYMMRYREFFAHLESRLARDEDDGGFSRTWEDREWYLKGMLPDKPDVPS